MEASTERLITETARLNIVAKWLTFVLDIQVLLG
jgi:hypothetical protein